MDFDRTFSVGAICNLATSTDNYLKNTLINPDSKRLIKEYFLMLKQFLRKLLRYKLFFFNYFNHKTYIMY